MSEHDKKPVSPGSTSRSTDTVDDQFEAVKDLLLGTERANIGGLEARLSALENTAESDPDFSHRMGGLMAQSLGEMDDASRKAVSVHLAGLLKDDIKNEISQSQPQILQAVVPSFSALIRKGIQAEFEKLIAYIDDRLNGANSPVKRAEIRMKSLLTGRSEAEIWLETFPQYSLGSVLLVHRPSGMMIKSLRRERSPETGGIIPGGEISSDGDGNEEMIAAMVSTIANFANDAFVDTQAGQLKTMDFDSGDLVLVSSPLVQLAVLVEGPMPLDLEDRIESVFENILTKHEVAFARFDGEVSATDDALLQNDLRKILELSPDDGEPANAGGEGSAEGEIDPSAVQSERPWWQKFWVWGAVFSILILMVLWLGSALQDMRRNNLISRAHRAVDADRVLQAYPIEIHMDRGSDIMMVSGLLSHPAQINALNLALTDELPFLLFDNNVRTVWDETVSPQIDVLNVKVATNSSSIANLDEEVSIQKIKSRDIESAVSVANQNLDILKSSVALSQATFLTEPLADLRTEIEGFMALPGFSGQYQFDALSSSSIDRMVAGLTIVFDANGRLIEPNRAFRVGETLAKVQKTGKLKRNLALVAVVSGSDSVGLRAIEQARQVLVANGVDSSRFEETVILTGTDFSQNNVGNGLVENSWVGANFVGFAFVD